MKIALFAAFLILVPSGALAAESIRVLVFPHILRYATPQGRETRITEVSLRTAGVCVATPLTGGATQASSTLNFRFETTPDPIFVECTQPATVVRENGVPSYSYSGTFRVERSTDPSLPAHLMVVNSIDLETYLEGVVPTEMPASWNAEALKAQAVAARTYAHWELALSRSAPRHPSYDFDDTVQYQAYLGVFSPALPSTEQAVRLTKGQVLVGADAIPIKAYFHADSGGHTEDASNFFPDSPSPTCIGKPEVYDPATAPPAWTVTLELAEASSRLVAAGAFPATEKLASLEVDETTRFKSGRANRVKARLMSGRELWLGAEPTRYALKLRSTLFELKRQGTNLVFNGRGYGHGVGMSQWGARLLADQSRWDYGRILEFYYTGAKIVR
ncbi:MAG TPA: SpoIID/LytB domain-containing protein [Bdellovibrionota bacterium]|nr:SpoIID/LytB domain-containing protein [Bdellovibrionota bacterium]